MRRALLAAVLAAAACGDRSPAAAPAAVPPPAPAPFEMVFDDAHLDAAVFDAARSGKLDALASLKLPPRCDRVRTAVHALHEHLLGVQKAPPDRAQLLAALDALAKCDGGASAKSLGPLVAAWRAWTDEQAATEAALARRAAAGFAVLGREKLDAAALQEAIRGSQLPPPKSPSSAELALLRAALLVAASPSDAGTSREIADAYEHALQLFDDLGWPGGFGSSADVLAKRVLAANPASRLGIHLADLAQAAFARSGDEVRASLVFLTLADAAERRGDVKAAATFADAGRERLAAAGGRGRELYDVTLRHGSLAQMLGQQAAAARDLGKAWDEARAAQLGAPACVAAAERFATSCFILGRFADARATATAAMGIHDAAVAAGAAEIEPARTTLAEIAAQAALETGDAREAARLYGDAAARHEKAATTDPSSWERHDSDALLAADALLKGGDATGAAAAIKAVTSRDGVEPPVHAHASSVWREAKRFDEAEAELARAETEGGEDFKDALTEERARLAAARGDRAGARELFARAVARVKKDADTVVGWDAARVMLDWARMEMDAGRLFEASELAGGAIVELRGSGLEMELDRARELYVAIERRRLWFGEAAKAAEQRVAAGPPGDPSRRDDALLDLFLIRLELALEEKKDAAKNLLAAAEMFPEGWRRDLAMHITKGFTGEQPLSPRGVSPVPADAPARWRLLFDVSDVVFGHGDGAEIAKRCGAAEPELRRWAVSRMDLALVNLLEAMELRRRADIVDLARSPAVTQPDEAVLFIEPIEGRTVVSLVRDGASVCDAGVPGDAGLADFWDATWVDPKPEHLTAAAKRVADALFTSGIVKRLDGVKRLYISVAEPLGPLPYDLLPFGDGLLIDRFEVVTVDSLTELSRARTRPEPPMLPALIAPHASLDDRHALVVLGDGDPKARARLFELMGRLQNEGKDASAALREAKLALRAEWRPDPNRRPVLPAWAAFLLRGAP